MELLENGTVQHTEAELEAEQEAKNITREATARKWTSTAGPRQTKAVNQALSKLQWEGKAHRELSGTIGGEEHSAILTPMFTGTLSPACIESMQTIGNKYGYTVTRDNYRQIEADCIAAIERVRANMPVVDNRITPEAAQERDQANKKRRIKQEEQAVIKAAENHTKAEALLKEYPYLETADNSTKSGHALAGANIRAILKSNYPGHVFSVKTSSFSGGDSCDVNWTDGPTDKEVNALILRFKAGSFDGMTDMYNYCSDVWHKLFGDVKYLSAGRQITPQRYIDAGETEGMPVFLTQYGELDRNKMDEAVMRHISNIIDGISYYTAPVTTAHNTPSEAGTGTTGGQVRRNIPKNGVEVLFPAKPSLETIAALKSEGFRWSMTGKLWYARYSEVTEAAAIRIIGAGE
jgi:hypothetical protein